jgi:hypothetical protein
LIEELQRDALDRDVRVTELLEKCLVVATKLRLNEFADWVHLELDGYGEKTVPEYRVLSGTAMVFNPYQGYQPLQFESADGAERFSKMHFNTPLGQMEYQLLSSEESGSAFQVSFTPQIEKMLRDSIEFGLQPSLRFGAAQIQGVLDAVRKIILEWSLKLEADGIMGDGMSFSSDEKQRAQSSGYNIKNVFQGDISNSQIQIESPESIQSQIIEFDLNKVTDLIDALNATSAALGLNATEQAKLESEVRTLEAQVSSPDPKHSIVKESLGSVRRILEGAGGNLVASGILNQLGAMFGI